MNHASGAGSIAPPVDHYHAPLVIKSSDQCIPNDDHSAINDGYRNLCLPYDPVKTADVHGFVFRIIDDVCSGLHPDPVPFLAQKAVISAGGASLLNYCNTR